MGGSRANGSFPDCTLSGAPSKKHSTGRMMRAAVGRSGTVGFGVVVHHHGSDLRLPHGGDQERRQASSRWFAEVRTSS